jgi:hypothetical protein
MHQNFHRLSGEWNPCAVCGWDPLPTQATLAVRYHSLQYTVYPTIVKMLTEPMARHAV